MKIFSKSVTVNTAHFGNRLFTIYKILKWDVGGIPFTENVSRYVVIFSAKYFHRPQEIFFTFVEKGLEWENFYSKFLVH